MEDKTSSLKTSVRVILVGIVMLIGAMLIHAYFQTYSIFVMCDVGQGDGLYLRTPTGKDIVIDTGPDDKISYCLGEHMPMYDTYIDAIFISHPHLDHYGGLMAVLHHYSVGKVYTPNVSNKSRSYQDLLTLIRKKSHLEYAYAGDHIVFDPETEMIVYWPTEDYVSHNSRYSHALSQNLTDGDLNAFSLVIEARVRNTYLLLTGDITKEILSVIIPQLESSGKLDIFKLGHHGSKTSTTPQILQDLHPKVALISAALHNWYHHPSKEVLKMLSTAKIQTYVTAYGGEEVFVLCNDAWRLQKGYSISFFLNC